MSTKNIIISLVGLAIIVGAALFVFRYEYVVVTATNKNPIVYIIRFDRFTLDRCLVETDFTTEYAEKEFSKMRTFRNKEFFLIRRCG